MGGKRGERERQRVCARENALRYKHPFLQVSCRQKWLTDQKPVAYKVFEKKTCIFAVVYRPEARSLQALIVACVFFGIYRSETHNLQVFLKKPVLSCGIHVKNQGLTGVLSSGEE